MQKKEKSAAKSKAKEKWFVYMLRCRDKTLYTGITKDLNMRLEMHGLGKASRYTRTRRPVKLVYKEVWRGRAQALIREYEVKASSKKKKEEMIRLDMSHKKSKAIYKGKRLC